MPYRIIEEAPQNITPNQPLLDQSPSTPQPTSDQLFSPKLTEGLKDVAGKVGQSALGFLGSFGDIASLPVDFTNWVSGQRTPTYEELVKKWPSLPWTTKMFDETAKDFQKFKGEKVKPETITDEAFKEFGSYINPFTGSIGLGKSLALSVIPNMAKEFSKSLNLGEKGQAASKLATALPIMLLGGRVKVKELENSSWENAKNSVQGVMGNAGPVDNALKKAQEFAFKGLKDNPARNIIREVSENISNKINMGKLPLDEALETVKDINFILRDKKLPKQAKPYLNTLKDSLNTVLNNYGGKDKAFKNAYNSARDLTRGLNHISKVTETLGKVPGIKELAKNPLSSYGLFHMLNSLSEVAHVPKLGKLAATGLVAAPAAYRASQFIDLIIKSTNARKAYTKMATNLLLGKSNAFKNSFKAFNQIAEKHTKNEKKPEGKYRFIN